MTRASDDDSTKGPKRPPAKTVQGRENELVSLAMDAAEKQIRNGTASSQVITHFLKLGTAREMMERTRLEAQTKLDIARVEQMESNARMEDLYENAIKAMRGYAGQPTPDEDEDD